ncbi:carbohydrate-binding family 9-like protein [Bacteroidota bacterium]
MHLLRYSTFIFSFTLVISSLHAQQAVYPAKYVCYSVGEGINIDGQINESDWEKVPWTEDFVDIEGIDKPKPTYRTRAKMLWNENYFYVAAELEEPHIWGTYKKHDMVIFHEHDFEVFIDPDGDTHQYYELEINARGTVWDLLLGKPYRDGGPAINAWDINGLKSAVHLYGDINNPDNEDERWTIELAFPWEVLKECARPRRRPMDGDQWRVNFSRVEWKLDVVEGKYQKTINQDTGRPYPEFNWVWSPQGVIAMHQPETWAYVQFSEVIAGQGVTAFHVNPEEEIKWALREVYYLEQDYMEEKGSYSSNHQEIGVDKIQLGGQKFKPDIIATKDMFHCYYPGKKAGSIWHIRDDGKVWMTFEK